LPLDLLATCKNDATLNSSMTTIKLVVYCYCCNLLDSAGSGPLHASFLKTILLASINGQRFNMGTMSLNIVKSPVVLQPLQPS
jgi:hypothetical protein